MGVLGRKMSELESGILKGRGRTDSRVDPLSFRNVQKIGDRITAWELKNKILDDENWVLRSGFEVEAASLDGVIIKSCLGNSHQYKKIKIAHTGDMNFEIIIQDKHRKIFTNLDACLVELGYLLGSLDSEAPINLSRFED